MTASLPLAPTVTLAHGAKMPALALGTWPMDNAEAATAVEHALRTGYRHVDTAENYRNEEGVGEGIKRSEIPREELFITTKFNREWHSSEGVRTAFTNAVERLGVEYLDLFMVHWPNPDQDQYVKAVTELTKLRDEGLIRAVGVSNFLPQHLQRLIDAGVTPEVNQIQLDPAHVSPEQQTFHHEHGIVTVAYSPLGRGGAFLDAPELQTIAATHGKTPSQVTLRWHVQQGNAAAPKSSNPERQRENLDIFDFTLTDAEMATVTALNTGGPWFLHPEEFGH